MEPGELPIDPGALPIEPGEGVPGLSELGAWSFGMLGDEGLAGVWSLGMPGVEVSGCVRSFGMPDDGGLDGICPSGPAPGELWA
jgi:hypothetical protein